jgi:hypothetical protein
MKIQTKEENHLTLQLNMKKAHKTLAVYIQSAALP